MESKICMNASCRKTTSTEWKRGWALRSGGFADLCYSCGSAFENGHFCETFHTEQSGWRECYLCSKHLHCGCIASVSLIQLLDYGGVGCTTCANRYKPNLAKRSETSDGYGALIVKVLEDRQVKALADGQATNFGSRLSQLCQIMEANEPNLFSSPSLRSDTRSTQAEEKQEEILPQHGETGKETQPALESASFFKRHGLKSMMNNTGTQASLVQPSLSMGLRVTTSSGQLLSNGSVEGKEQKKASSSHKVSESSISTFTTPFGSGKTVVSQMRIAPPVEGRGKNHLLPRYRPRMSDQELQKISGDLNSSVVPLFEKILSASDAGRIGRLVLPKACAEAYFPTINQSEGIPLKIQDVTGKEWTFQFRFWPNNNSRMYVLEGVTPCIQSMQLQAGDTVIFSRIEPGGKLVMGFRKTKNPGEQQGLQTSPLTNGNSSGETPSPGFSGSLSTVNGKDTQVNGMSEIVLNGGRNGIESSQIREKKRTRRNIGSKSKRLLMHNEEATALQLTWEEAQDLLRPPPCAKPTIVTVEGHEFEEYDEPPVFGKRTFFTSSPAREQEQWAQCDNCSKWRRLPVDVLLPPKWTCSENVWDSSRCSCSVAEEFSHKELENLLRLGKDFKKQRTTEREPPSGLDALACAAVLGGDLDEPSSAGATTRHPRHRPGCTCIVCIQPPSGKGKHNPNCDCNVCSTVKRRFKTLMQRKKNRQLERESKEAKKDDHQNLDHRLSDSSGTQSLVQNAAATTAWIDLNIRPHRDEVQKAEDKNPRSGEMSLLLLADQVKENEEAENEPEPGVGGIGASAESRCRDAAAASALVTAVAANLDTHVLP